MPLYDYKCKQCGHIFEVQQKMTEEKLKYCPKCKGEIRRLINPSGIIFKGPGFHVNDYGKREVREPKKTTEKPKETKSSPAASSPAKSK